MQMIKRLNGESVTMMLIGLFIGSMLGKVIIDHTTPASTVSNEPTPFHGWIEDTTARARSAPFRIITPQGSRAFLVKLVDVETGNTALSIFLEPGKTFDTAAPVGSFILRWASGKDWNDKAHLFRPSTDYQEAIRPLTFREAQGGYTGNTIELTPKGNGNLLSNNISSSKFEN